MSEAKLEVAEHADSRHDTIICPLFRLPLEARQLIYKHVFSGISVNVFQIKPGDEKKCQIVDINVFLTSKKTYSDTRPIFYTTVCFRFWSDWLSEQDEWPNFLRAKFGDNAQIVKHVYCLSNRPTVVATLSDLFPTLKIFELALGQIRLRAVAAEDDPDLAADSVAVKICTDTVKLALQDNYMSSGVKSIAIEWKRLGPSRGFRVKLHWYLIIYGTMLRGQIDLDEWVLRIFPNNNVGKPCMIRQSPWIPD